METLDKHFRKLAKAAFERHGFASEQLISQWGAIVGPEYAAISVPDKIKWPRSPAENTRKTGGTLVVRAQAGRGLDLHYEAPRIIERVNQFLGYGAISTLKIIQSSLAAPTPQPKPLPPNPQATKAWAAKLDDIADENLKAALERLAGFAAPKGPATQNFSTGENRDWPHPSTSVRKMT